MGFSRETRTTSYILKSLPERNTLLAGYNTRINFCALSLEETRDVVQNRMVLIRLFFFFFFSILSKNPARKKEVKETGPQVARANLGGLDL